MAEPSGVTAAQQPLSLEQAWNQLVAARTSAEFCQAWLAIVCARIDGVATGAVLLESQESGTFAPISVWPQASADMARLGPAAEQALTQRRGVVATDEATGTAQVAYPIEASQRIVGAVALELKGDVKAALRQLHWGIGWLRDLFLRRELADADERMQRIGTVMEAVATSLREGKLQQVLFNIANHLARELNCSRVAIGLAKGMSVKVKALSDAAWIEKNAIAVKRYGEAMDEAVDQRAPVIYVHAERDSADSPGPTPAAHQRLAEESGAAAIVSIPLLLGERCIGALSFERTQEDGFNASELAWIEAFAGLLPAIIDHKRRADRNYLLHLLDDTRALLERLFGPRHLIWKFSTAVILALVLTLSVTEIDYRVSAKTVIEGEVLRSAVAPFEGYLAASHVRAGDTVQAGQVLCELDERDLKIEQEKWRSERAQADKKLREAMSQREFSAVQISTAQLRQAEAQLALATERITRSKILAPFDGIVVSGDLSQLIGSPVEQGQKLFEIAPLASYRVILQVDEREIRNIDVGQPGQLVISGIAGEPTAFDVIKITPVATAEEGSNFFRVEARLHSAPARLRPGMEGVGKIRVGRRGLWWVLTHSFSDWLRLTFWTWTP